MAELVEIRHISTAIICTNEVYRDNCSLLVEAECIIVMIYCW